MNDYPLTPDIPSPHHQPPEKLQDQWDGPDNLTFLRSIPAIHAKRNQVESGSLYEALDIETTQNELARAAAAGDASRYEQRRIAVADRISRQVNRALWYEEDDFTVAPGFRAKGWKVPKELSRIGAEQVTDCYGYALITSKCFELVGLDHGVGFVNGHCVVLIPTMKDGISAAWMVDSVVPRFSQDLTYMTSSWSNVAAESDKYGRGAVMLFTADIGKHMRMSIVEIARTYTHWVRQPKPYETIDVSNEATLLHKTKLVLSIFSMETGRRVLQATNRLKIALAQGDLDTALDNLRDMHGLYPELDARVEHTEIRTLVRALCERGDVVSAKEAVAAYFDSFVISAHPDIELEKAKCQRLIAERDAASLQLVRSSLEEAYRRSQHAPFIEAVGGRLSKLVAQIL